MHRIILNAPKGQFVDHKDGNGLNNQKSNLRFCNFSQNRMNTGANKNNKLGIKGVRMRAPNLYEVTIKFNGKNIYLGRFDNSISAAEAYQKKAKELFGEFVKW